MKVIIAGSRSITDYSLLLSAMETLQLDVTEVVSGTAKGVDQLDERWAQEKEIPIKKFPADWKTFKGGAGYVRNEQMAKYGEILVALWGGKSKGTQHMIDLARKADLEVHVVEVNS